MKRLLFISFLTVSATIIELFHWFYMGLDHLVFPSFRKLNVTEPLFITGMIRTGTTYFFQSLAADTSRFTAMKLWEILLAPSIIQKKILLFIRRADRYTGSHLKKTWIKIEKKVFRGINPIHSISLLDIEEDEFLFLHRAQSASLIFLFPGCRSVLASGWFDKQIPVARRSSLMKFYQRCIQRHLYTFGSDRQYLAKSASHTPRLQSLYQTFPDLVTIYLYRTPLEVIPSTLSLFSFTLNSSLSSVNSTELCEITMDIADHWYWYPLELRDSWQGRDFLFVSYESITKSIKPIIRDLYKSLDYEYDENFIRYLAETEKSKYVSRHRYAPEDFSLTEDDIYQRYRDIISSYESVLNKAQ